MSLSNLKLDGIRAWKHALDLSEADLGTYAPIGFFVSRIASLEFDLDELIFTSAERVPELCFKLSPRPPFRYEDKIRLVIDLFVCVPLLRECGDYSQNMDLNGLGYRLEEVFSFRNILVHGEIELIEHRDGQSRYRIRKYSRGEGRSFLIDEFVYSTGHLARVLDTAAYCRSLIKSASRALRTGETDTKMRDNLLRSHAALREMDRLIAEG